MLSTGTQPSADVRLADRSLPAPNRTESPKTAMLSTERLTLRPFTAGDAEGFLALAGHWEVARMTSDIPHPLSLGDARQWLEPAPHEARFALMLSSELIGGAGYFVQASGDAELGFWLGRAYWGQGLATEAVKAVVGYGLA